MRQKLSFFVLSYCTHVLQYSKQNVSFGLFAFDSTYCEVAWYGVDHNRVDGRGRELLAGYPKGENKSHINQP
jgi:hypothetical protein